MISSATRITIRPLRWSRFIRWRSVILKVSRRFSAVFINDVRIRAAALAGCGPSQGRGKAYSASDVRVQTIPTPVNRMSCRTSG